MFYLFAHNFVVYPINRGFDVTAHIEYIKYLQTNKQLPLPIDGWEYFQAPLYYYIASFFTNISFVRLINLFSLFTILIIIWNVIVKNLNKNIELFSTYFFVIIATTPILIYLSPAISNEFFSMSLITLTLYFYIYVYSKDQEKNKNKYILSLLLGLSLLAKATAIFVFIVLILVEFINSKNLKSFINQKMLIFFLAFLLGGWFYLRSTYLYGSPVYQPADYLPLENYGQQFVDRDLNFFFNPISIIKLDIFNAHYYSFLGGTIFSWFYDVHTILVPPQEFSKAGAIIAIYGISNLVISIYGLIEVFCKIINEKKLTLKDQVFIFYSFLIFLMYIMYNFKLPFYSTVKSAFIFSLFLPYINYYIIGINKIYTINKYLIYLYLCISFFVFLLVFRHFYVNPLWYS